MLHDGVISMGIYSYISVSTEAEVHDITENSMLVRIAGNTMDDVIRLLDIKPTTIEYL